MKRIVSIFLTLLLLLNVMGFFGIFLGAKYSNTQQLISDFDNDNYSHMQTVTFKIAVSVPYVTETEFQRVDGEIEHNGEFYRVVKQRYANDSLYIVCVKDVESKHISQALNDYVKTFTDKPVDGKSHTTPLPSFIKEYLVGTYTIKSSSEGWSSNVRHESAPVVFIPSFCASIIHPPERA